MKNTVIGKAYKILNYYNNNRKYDNQLASATKG